MTTDLEALRPTARPIDRPVEVGTSVPRPERMELPCSVAVLLEALRLVVALAIYAPTTIFSVFQKS